MHFSESVEAARPLRVLAWPAFANTTGNPYNRLLYEAVTREGVRVEDFTLRRALTGSYDLWHLHWPDDFLSYPSVAKAAVYVAALLTLMAVAKVQGTRILWTVHDLGPHESRHSWLERLFWPLFLPMIDGFFSLSQHGKTAAREQYPTLRAVPGFVVPHGHYREAYPHTMSRKEARARFGIDPDATMLLYIGRIRPYKNVVRLVDTMQEVEDENAQLYVAGNPASEALRRGIEDAAAGDGRVHLDLRFVPDDEIAAYCTAADLVVLPYRDILHSGSALLALSFDTPVLIPDRGAMSELQAHIGPDWVHTYDGPFTPDVLRDGIRWVHAQARPGKAPLHRLDWDVLARKTVDVYYAIAGRG